MMKFAAIFVLGYLLFGTVAGDWMLRGRDTAGHGRDLLMGAAILVLLFLVGIRATGRYGRFFGFSPWQWRVLPPAALCIGVALRIFVLG